MSNLFWLTEAQMARLRPSFPKSHGVPRVNGRPIRFFMTLGQVSDCTGAAALLGSLPKAEWLLANRGYAAD